VAATEVMGYRSQELRRRRRTMPATSGGERWAVATGSARRVRRDCCWWTFGTSGMVDWTRGGRAEVGAVVESTRSTRCPRVGGDLEANWRSSIGSSVFHSRSRPETRTGEVGVEVEVGDGDGVDIITARRDGGVGGVGEEVVEEEGVGVVDDDAQER
jgi:hypothetical protein